MDVIQHLWFERDMDEAVSLYTSLIPHSEITG
ncbi:MAG TPA: VOC family protein, partial [Phenylobacterium sp.]|nr:VOC family protein [Phenylobacterium sp.]